MAGPVEHLAFVPKTSNDGLGERKKKRKAGQQEQGISSEFL